MYNSTLHPPTPIHIKRSADLEECLPQRVGLHDIPIIIVEFPGLDLSAYQGQFLVLGLHLLMEPWAQHGYR